MGLVAATESITRHQATVTNAASQLVAANSERSGIQVQIDPAAANQTVYLLLASTGTPGPTIYDAVVATIAGSYT